MNDSQDIKKSVEARATALRNRIIQSKIATPEHLVGCSDEEIEALEKACKLTLPYSYKVFLKNFGHCFGGVANDVEFLYRDVFPLTKIAREILQEDDPVLPENAFVFTMRYGEQFFFFEAEEGNEVPPIFYYMEGDESFSKSYDSVFDLWEGEVELKAEILARHQERYKSKSE